MNKFLILIGNLMPPPLNKYFYKLGGVKFKNINKCWIGMFNHLDGYDPSMIYIGENVNISYKVIWVTHFDPTKSRNPFAYFTQIVYYAFLRRIAKEKRQMDIKDKILEKSGYEHVFSVDGDASADYNQIKNRVEMNQKR